MNRKIVICQRISGLVAVIMLLTVTVACGGSPGGPTDEPISPSSVPATEAPFPLTTGPSTEVAITISPTPPPTGTLEAVASEPAFPEYRRLTLEYPSRIKAGAESDIIRLTLEVDTLGNITPTAEIGGNVVEGEVIEIPNLYETHNVAVEARYDVAGLEVRPPGSTIQPLKQGEAATFYWSIGAQEVGTYRGTIWVYLNFEDLSSGEKSRKPVSAQIIEIEAVDFFGFSTNFVRTSGVVGSVLGLVAGFPFFDNIVKYLWEKRKKETKKPSKPVRKK